MNTLINFELADPTSADATAVLQRLSADLLERTGCSGQASFKPEDLHSMRSFFVIARSLDAKSIGCCALREIDSETGELKRMFADHAFPGTGSKVMAFVQAEAHTRGYRRLRLATRRVNLNAIKFYQKHQFQEIDNYGNYLGRDAFICFEKTISVRNGRLEEPRNQTLDEPTISIEICKVDPENEEAAQLLLALSSTLAQITGNSGRQSFDPDDVRSPKASFVLARNTSGRAIACGAFRPLHANIAELKRMYAEPGNKGVGSAVLDHLENEAREIGYTELWLETRRVNTRAVQFYLKHGYTEIPNFGKYIGMTSAICMRKQL